jgi:hypothetical protein
LDVLAGVASMPERPPDRLDPDPAVNPEASADEPSEPAEGEPGLEAVPSDPPAGSPVPAVAGPPVPAEWHGAPLDGRWLPLIARLPIAWRHRWAERAEMLQAAGLPRDIAEDRALPWTVEEMAAVS